MQVLITEDDLPTRKMLQFVLERQAGFQATEVSTAEQALAILANRSFDLLVTDLRLPAMDGIELVRRVRGQSSIPIIMVSGVGEVSERVRGLRCGADDYIVKPFDPSELEARIEALLRRARMRIANDESGVIRVGDLSIDLTRHVVSVAGRGPIRLTPTEVRLLIRLANAPGNVQTRADLAEAVWGVGAPVSQAAINTYIADLRRKLEPNAGRPQILQTVRGTGYRLAV